MIEVKWVRVRAGSLRTGDYINIGAKKFICEKSYPLIIDTGEVKQAVRYISSSGIGVTIRLPVDLVIDVVRRE